MNIVIFGPPGAGKGTQSNLLVKKYNLHQLSTGALLRKEINDKTELGIKISSIINTGNLVSDKIAGDLIEKYISNKIYKNRLIFDGYPRNLNQARNLHSVLTKYEQKMRNLGLKPYFNSADYSPHITIGYVGGDVHGVSKKEETCVHYLD